MVPSVWLYQMRQTDQVQRVVCADRCRCYCEYFIAGWRWFRVAFTRVTHWIYSEATRVKVRRSMSSYTSFIIKFIDATRATDNVAFLISEIMSGLRRHHLLKSINISRYNNITRNENSKNQSFQNHQQWSAKRSHVVQYITSDLRLTNKWNISRWHRETSSQIINIPSVWTRKLNMFSSIYIH